MATLVTGAGGFLGQLLTERLVEKGETVHALLHASGNERLKDLPGVKLFRNGDVEDKESIRKAMEGCEQVYHLAALATNWVPDPTLFERVNLHGTENVLSCAEELGVKKLVHVSSAATLGPQRNEDPVTEKHQLGLEEALTLYEKSKIRAEAAVKEHVEKGGMNAVTVNPTRLFGPGPLKKSNGVTRMIRDYLTGKWRIIPGNGKGVGNYVFTHDVIEGFLLAMEHGKAGERYLLGGNNIDFDGFFETLAEVTGCRRRMFHLPVPLMLAISQGMKFWSDISNSPPLITPDWVRKYMGEQWAVDSSKARKELGYEPTALKEGFRITTEWLLKEGEVELPREVGEKEWEEG